MGRLCRDGWVATGPGHPDPAPFNKEFYRLAKRCKWDKDERKKQRILLFDAEFDAHFGSDATSLKNWQKLCHLCTINPAPETIPECMNVSWFAYIWNGTTTNERRPWRASLSISTMSWTVNVRARLSFRLKLLTSLSTIRRRKETLTHSRKRRQMSVKRYFSSNFVVAPTSRGVLWQSGVEPDMRQIGNTLMVWYLGYKLRDVE